MTEQDFSDLPQPDRRGALLAYLEYVIREAVAEALVHITPDQVRDIVEKEICDD